nr:putative NADH dehydrogenase [uncultured bacterium]
MLLWSLIAVPLAAGALLAVAGQGANRAAPAAGVLVAVTALGLAVAAAVARPVVDAPLVGTSRAGLAVDGLSALMIVMVAAVTVAVLAFAAGDSELRTARFVGFVLLFAGAMLVTVTATTLAELVMAWEVMGATSWALIAHDWRDPATVRAAHTAFLTTRVADLGLYVAAGAALAGGVGSLALADLPTAGGAWLHVVAAGVVVAALGKSAQLPLSFWLSQAMRGPSPVSALLHSATMVAAGAYLLLRLVALLGAAGWAGPTVAWVGAATALLLGLVAVAQADLKLLLAASTCAQIGFMVLAAGVGAVGGGAAQLVAHAATKCLLFLAAGAWLVSLGTRQLGELRGAARRFPLVGVTFTVGAATLAGLPPLALWVTKDAVLAAALGHSVALFAVGMTAAVVSAVYSAKAVWYVWQPAPAGFPVVATGRRTRRVPAAMRLPLVALAAFAAALGVLPLLTSGVLAVAPAPTAWELVRPVRSPSPRPSSHGGPGPGSVRRFRWQGGWASSAPRTSWWCARSVRSPWRWHGSTTARSTVPSRRRPGRPTGCAGPGPPRRARGRRHGAHGRGRCANTGPARPPAADRPVAPVLRPGSGGARGVGPTRDRGEVTACCR